jgi:hypothetical protein
MHLFIAFDGSDDGYEALRTLLGQFDRDRSRRVTIAVIAWPIRESPIWEKALAHEIEVDDLHRAMAEVASRETARVRALFAQDAAVRTVVAEGDPIEAILNCTAGDPPDLALVGVTGGRHRHAVLAIVNEVIIRTSYLVVVAHGKRQTDQFTA